MTNSHYLPQDREKEEQLNSKLTQVSVEEILDAQRREIETRQEKSANLRSRLKQRGVYNNNPLLEDNEWTETTSPKVLFKVKIFRLFFASS